MNFGQQKFNPNDFGQGLSQYDQKQQQQYPPKGQLMPQGGMMAPPGMFPYMQGGNMGGLGPQMNMPGQFQPMKMGAFRPKQEPAQSRQEEVKAQPIVGGMEEFPGQADAIAEKYQSNWGKDRKRQRKAKVVEAVKNPEEEADLTTAWKGKPSTFFLMKEAASPPQVMDPQNPGNLELTDDQWDFIFQYHPVYAEAPYKMMSWIFGEALKNEETQSRLNGAQLAGEESAEEQELFSSEMDRVFYPSQKQMIKKKQKQAEAEKVKAQLDKLLVEQKKLTEESERVKEEQKRLPQFQDMKVNAISEACDPALPKEAKIMSLEDENEVLKRKVDELSKIMNLSQNEKYKLKKELNKEKEKNANLEAQLSDLKTDTKYQDWEMV